MCSFWACSGIFVEGRAACIRAKERSTNALRSFCKCCVYKDERVWCQVYSTVTVEGKIGPRRVSFAAIETHWTPFKAARRPSSISLGSTVVIAIATIVFLSASDSLSLTQSLLSFASVRSGSAESAISACPQQNSCNPSAAAQNLAAPWCRLCMSGTF
ncbi:hypothetical protein HDV62DRAFT_298808 [Trichoderma sp. SZMC 28011]